MKSTYKAGASDRANRTQAMVAALTIALIAIVTGLTHPATAHRQITPASMALEQGHPTGEAPTEDTVFSANWAGYWTVIGNAAGIF
jgi:Na+/H+ antiporter NhaD/arsenite permease-like protein